MIKNKDIICISVSDWLSPWGSKQHLMVKLAKHNRVLYIEYQGSCMDFIKYPRYFLSRLINMNKLRQVNDNIYTYTPIPVFPFGNYFIFINRINQSILCFILHRLMNKLKFKSPVLWFYSPISAYLVGKMDESIVIYHCAADFTQEKKNYLRKNTIGRLEMYLVKHAQIVLTLTKELCRRFKKFNQNTFYFPSAVDIEYFENIRNNDSEEPADLSFIKKPRLGIVGYLDGNIIDTDLLDRIAKMDDREWSIVLIGPLFKKAKTLVKLKRENKNVYFLGEKPSALIPLYLKYIDICLVPYVRNKFTNNISPLKLYEYLAMGKPVVSTLFSDDLNNCKDVVGIASNKEEFLKLVHAFLNRKDEEEEFIARINFASENSWQKRLNFLSEKI